MKKFTDEELEDIFDRYRHNGGILHLQVQLIVQLIFEIRKLKVKSKKK